MSEEHGTAAETQTPEPAPEPPRPATLAEKLMSPVGARALALAGFVALVVSAVDSRTSVTTP
ncbi:MAG TPA: hypothetical protein VFN97_17250 [Actinospica sp.]|nr:hypothetical protein [Actinospica sp.]